ncbi:MAG: hypothetical protein JSR36_03685 [Proteobacteria bacterium]|nr:hypothetical protein [Pseudomonadota bacterium]
MSPALQAVAVGLIVVMCAVYSTWRLLSGSARQRLLAVLAKVPLLGSRGWFRALQERTLAGLGAGCGSCPGATPSPSRKRTPGALPR